MVCPIPTVQVALRSPPAAGCLHGFSEMDNFAAPVSIAESPTAKAQTRRGPWVSTTGFEVLASTAEISPINTGADLNQCNLLIKLVTNHAGAREISGSRTELEGLGKNKCTQGKNWDGLTGFNISADETSGEYDPSTCSVSAAGYQLFLGMASSE